MKFDWTELYNPVFGWRCSTRDPAAVWHEGKFYLYFTVQFEQQRWGAPEGYRCFVTVTEDFREFTSPRPVTPTGYVSPGNVLRFRDRWVMSVTRYPRPCAVALTESDDLLHWSEPRTVIPTFHGDYWGNNAHGPIDGYPFFWKDRCWMLYTDFKKGTSSQYLGLSVSDDLRTFENLTPDRPLLDSSFYDDRKGIENASLVIEEETLHLFCSVGMPEQRIAKLASNDIMHWPKLDAESEIGGLNQSWSQFIAGAQFVADWRDVTGFWTMLFMGTRHHDPYDRMMLGMARSRDLETWEVLPEGVPEEEYSRRCLAYREKYQEHGHDLS